jgi:hypothetical protein
MATLGLDASDHYNLLLGEWGITDDSDLDPDLFDMLFEEVQRRSGSPTGSPAGSPAGSPPGSPAPHHCPLTPVREKGKEEEADPDEDDPRKHCQICGEPYRGVHTPMALPCAHMFCSVCVASWEKRRKEDGESACCPDCRYQYTEEELLDDHDGPDLIPVSPPVPRLAPKRKRARASRAAKAKPSPKRRRQ